ncbi:WD domain-containing protein [Fusarium circinatum]|uniref:WD domain-containing protein n=1 Tax=Fusarium circinatum TaxID=48490 RepID=A0A8H5UJX2_FUSCI|nr:WD domain-containing protein [Fusarium circinatum]
MKFIPLKLRAMLNARDKTRRDQLQQHDEANPRSPAAYLVSSASTTQTAPATATTDLAPQTVSSGPEDAISLWNDAYDCLRRTDEQLIIAYEELLSRELRSEQGTYGHVESESDNHIDSQDVNHRHKQLQLIIKSGQQRAEEQKTTYTIFGKTFTVRDQASQAAEFVKSVKTIVDEAVKASPEAALAWAGICTVLPILLNPASAEASQQEGFAYVTLRMQFYGQLKSHLGLDGIENTAELRLQLSKPLVNMYQHMLEFQIRVVMRLYQTRLARLKDDVLKHEEWNAMLARIKEAEATFDRDVQLVTGLSLETELRSLNEKAAQFLDDLRSALPIAAEAQKSRSLVHSGYGDQYAAFDAATQNNISGNAIQYAGVTFYGPASGGKDR